MADAEESYRVYAIKYAHRERRSGANFIGGDAHDLPMPMDFFVWALVGAGRSFIVDTGFDQATAAKRGRAVLRPIEEGLAALGIAPESATDVILTHMHYDHAGNRALFPKARYHVQDREMAYCTGRCMCHASVVTHFEAEDVAAMVHRVFEGRVDFHDGDAAIAPGISLHRVGGHTEGMQVVRVHTQQGWMVLASDASHYYANMERRKPFPAVHDVGDMLEGFERLYSLADAPQFVIPGHDPEVMRRFPAEEKRQEGWIARLDLPPL